MTEPQTATGKRIAAAIDGDYAIGAVPTIERDDIVALEQETFALATLVDDEKRAMEHLLAASDIILAWGLKANKDELIQAVHVIQGFIVQHMLFRLNPVAWSRWYEKQEDERG